MILIKLVQVLVILIMIKQENLNFIAHQDPHYLPKWIYLQSKLVHLIVRLVIIIQEIINTVNPVILYAMNVMAQDKTNVVAVKDPYFSIIWLNNVKNHALMNFIQLSKITNVNLVIKNVTFVLDQLLMSA